MMSVDTTVFDPVSRKFASEGGSASVRIYHDLRQRILSFDLPPGAGLLRSELAKNYNVSVTPLRDALQLLEQNGLVKIFPQSRTLVTRIDEPSIYEALFLRRALETEVVRQLSRKDASDTIAKARDIIDLQRAVAEQKEQIRLFQELDEQFHRTMFEGAGQANLHDLIRSKSGHLDRVRRLQTHSSEKLAGIIAGHEAVIDSIAAQDENAAIEALRDHLRKPDDWVNEFRAKLPDYFD